MTYSPESLMAQVGCEKYPARWRDIFAEAMAEYDRSGCFLADSAYYDHLNEKYGCMETYGEIYKRAAIQTAADEPLARFLTLLAVALRDPVHRGEDIKQLSALTVPQGREPLAYRMVTGLALCSQLDEGNENLLARGVPDADRLRALRMAVDCGVNTYMRRHRGEPGYNLLDWAQLYIQARLFTIGRLEIEFCRSFGGKGTVFENAQGDRVALANDIWLHKSGFALGAVCFEEPEDAWFAAIEENEDAFYGYPYRADGYVDRHRVMLRKSAWRRVLAYGDPIIALHIPSHQAAGPLTPEAVDETIAATREFAAKYFSEYSYKAFGCHSWLMDPQLTELVGKESNIGRFTARFGKMTAKSSGKAVFNFIFNQPDMNFRVEDLPERTRLEKGLKAHYLNGQAIYEMIGYFF